MKINKIFNQDIQHHATLSIGQVVPDGDNCVQCGICSFYCPIDIDVRAHVWENESIQDSHCLTCGECVARCPRGVLHFERIEFSMENQM